MAPSFARPLDNVPRRPVTASSRSPCVLWTIAACALLLSRPRVALGDPADGGGETVAAEPSEPSEPSTTADDELGQDANYWLPAAESVAFNIAMNLVVLVGGADYAKISLSSMSANIRHGFEWDTNLFNTNQIRHPYQGATYFNLARSSGLPFWTSAGYTFMGSLMWELLMETEKPSYNDQVMTSYGGTLLGEGMYRLSEGLRWKSPSMWHEVAASLVSPASAFNRHVFRRRSLLESPPPLFASLRVGHSSFSLESADGLELEAGLGQLHVGFVASYGLPGVPSFEPKRPMDHFDLVADLSIAQRRVVGTLFLRGLLYGRSFGGDRLRGMWGLFGNYDYFSPSLVRVAAAGAGPGTTMQLRLSRRSFLQATYVASFAPVAAAGIVEGVGSRDYHFGPGTSQIAELRLGTEHLGALTLTNRSFAVFDVATDEYSAVSYGSLSGQIKVWRNHGLGFEVIASTRRESEQDEFVDTGAQLLLFYSLLSDTSFGAVLNR